MTRKKYRMRHSTPVVLILYTCFLTNMTLAKGISSDGLRYLSGSCISCHSASETSPSSIPSLVGRSQASILSAMLAFSDGTRNGLLMQQIANGYTKDEMAQIARYLSIAEPR